MKLLNIQVSDCVLSKTNTKGRNEGVKFNELVASIKEKGVLTPVLARMIKGVGGKFEIVAGNRRFAAVKELGLETIPAMVSEMSDIEAREAQIVENLQRDDIHPLDEGEAYRALIEKSKYELADVSAKVGKTVSYVRDRLLLTNLIPSVVKVFRAGEIKPGVASLIARLNEKMQKEALEYATNYGESADDVRNWIQRKTFEVSMTNPPWKDDEQMKEMLKGCEECEGKGGDLFGKKAAEVCTNPKCFAQKLTAFIAVKLQENPDLKKLSDNYSKSDNVECLSRNEYHEINSKKDKCNFMEKGIMVEGDSIGRMLFFCNNMECKKHHAEITKAVYKLSPEEKKARKAELLKKDKEKEKSEKELATALAKIKFPMSKKHLDVLVELVFRRFGFSYIAPLARRHGIKAVVKKQNGYSHRDLETPMKEYVEGLDDSGKLRFVFELALEATGGYDGGTKNKFLKNL